MLQQIDKGSRAAWGVPRSALPGSPVGPQCLLFEMGRKDLTVPQLCSGDKGADLLRL